MEKRRRARINHCLNELKALILDAMKKDVSYSTSRSPLRQCYDLVFLTAVYLPNPPAGPISMICLLSRPVTSFHAARMDEIHPEECRLLGYENHVRTSQETHYVSATETSPLMLCKI
jgi:hypothetical protein